MTTWLSLESTIVVLSQDVGSPNLALPNRLISLAQDSIALSMSFLTLH
jgi:hypothetical protein